MRPRLVAAPLSLPQVVAQTLGNRRLRPCDGSEHTRAPSVTLVLVMASDIKDVCATRLPKA